MASWLALRVLALWVLVGWSPSTEQQASAQHLEVLSSDVGITVPRQPDIFPDSVFTLIIAKSVDELGHGYYRPTPVIVNGPKDTLIQSTALDGLTLPCDYGNATGDVTVHWLFKPTKHSHSDDGSGVTDGGGNGDGGNGDGGNGDGGGNGWREILARSNIAGNLVFTSSGTGDNYTEGHYRCKVTVRYVGSVLSAPAYLRVITTDPAEPDNPSTNPPGDRAAADDVADLDEPTRSDSHPVSVVDVPAILPTASAVLDCRTYISKQSHNGHVHWYYNGNIIEHGRVTESRVWQLTVNGAQPGIYQCTVQSNHTYRQVTFRIRVPGPPASVNISQWIGEATRAEPDRFNPVYWPAPESFGFPVTHCFIEESNSFGQNYSTKFFNVSVPWATLWKNDLCLSRPRPSRCNVLISACSDVGCSIPAYTGIKPRDKESTSAEKLITEVVDVRSTQVSVRASVQPYPLICNLVFMLRHPNGTVQYNSVNVPECSTDRRTAVKTHLFSGLKPCAQYSLCVTTNFTGQFVSELDPTAIGVPACTLDRPTDWRAVHTPFNPVPDKPPVVAKMFRLGSTALVLWKPSTWCSRVVRETLFEWMYSDTQDGTTVYHKLYRLISSASANTTVATSAQQQQQRLYMQDGVGDTTYQLTAYSCNVSNHSLDTGHLDTSTHLSSSTPKYLSSSCSSGTASLQHATTDVLLTHSNATYSHGNHNSNESTGTFLIMAGWQMDSDIMDYVISVSVNSDLLVDGTILRVGNRPTVRTVSRLHNSGLFKITYKLNDDVTLPPVTTCHVVVVVTINGSLSGTLTYSQAMNPAVIDTSTTTSTVYTPSAGSTGNDITNKDSSAPVSDDTMIIALSVVASLLLILAVFGVRHLWKGRHSVPHITSPLLKGGSVVSATADAAPGDKAGDQKPVTSQSAGNPYVIVDGPKRKPIPIEGGLSILPPPTLTADGTKLAGDTDVIKPDEIESVRAVLYRVRREHEDLDQCDDVSQDDQSPPAQTKSDEEQGI